MSEVKKRPGAGRGHEGPRRTKTTLGAEQAVNTASGVVKELFASRILSEPVLEEIEFPGESDNWVITLGYFQKPNMPPYAGTKGALGHFLESQPERAYKVVTINDVQGSIVSVKDRES